MIFQCANGRSRKVKKPNKYLVDWSGKSRSIIQQKVKVLLKPHWEYDLVYEEFPLVGSRMTFDFFNASEGVFLEVDGRQHTEYVKHFHRNRQNFLNQIKRDVSKEEFVEANNLKLFRINEGEEINEQLLYDTGILTK